MADDSITLQFLGNQMQVMMSQITAFREVMTDIRQGQVDLLSRMGQLENRMETRFATLEARTLQINEHTGRIVTLLNRTVHDEINSLKQRVSALEGTKA